MTGLPLPQRRALPLVRPRTANQLDAWLRCTLDVTVPRRPLVAGHAAPFDYLAWAFFETAMPRDCVVWAARGSGKTFYAALATALDLLFKPGIDVRLLGGSLEQSRRMHEHLRTLFGRPELASHVDGAITERRVALRNGSRAEILAQSHTSVRGARPQKLRCDEAELFDPAIWRAAQLTTRSKRCGDVDVRASVEALSTWHRPGGLMRHLVDEAAGPSGARRLFRWAVVDVLETCPPERDCAECPLEPDCGGRAKRGAGHVAVDDALAMRRRADRTTWEAEMLCRRPSRTDAVFPEFDAAVHVVDELPPHVLAGAGDPAAGEAGAIAGMDLGFRAPTVVLFARLDDDGTLWIERERVAAGIVLAEHAEAIRAARPRPRWIGIDPAARQRETQTGLSAVTVLRRAGLTVRARPAPIETGVRLVRARLRPLDGPPRLLVHRGCTALIDALERHRYPEDNPECTVPIKDGTDHAVDALRYLLVCLDLRYETRCVRYL